MSLASFLDFVLLNFVLSCKTDQYWSIIKYLVSQKINRGGLKKKKRDEKYFLMFDLRQKMINLNSCGWKQTWEYDFKFYVGGVIEIRRRKLFKLTGKEPEFGRDRKGKK